MFIHMQVAFCDSATAGTTHVMDQQKSKQKAKERNKKDIYIYIRRMVGDLAVTFDRLFCPSP